MVYKCLLDGYYKVMSNIPKMGHLPTPVIQPCSSGKASGTPGFSLNASSNCATCGFVGLEDGEGQNFVRAMWVKQCHKAPIWEYGLYTTYKNGDLGDGLLAFDPRYVLLSFRKWYLQDSKCCFWV